MKTKTNLGELIAEKLLNDPEYYFFLKTTKRISALINQEVEKVYGKQQKTLESETPIANEVVNTETGLAPCPFCGSEARFGKEELGGEFAECSNPMCSASSKLVYPMKEGAQRHLVEAWNRRPPLLPSRESKPT